MRFESLTPSPSPMTLAQFTSVGLIVPHLRGADVAGVIQELSQAMQREGRVPDLLPFYQTALNREFLVSTDMEAGMAFPHARLPGLKELSFAFGRSDAPLLWGTSNGRAVRIVFLIAVPATDATQHLLLISGLARLAKDQELMDKLSFATDPVEILELLRRVKLRTHSVSALATPAAP
jgi:PTS system fructose-specific IIA component